MSAQAIINTDDFSSQKVPFTGKNLKVQYL